ncbi:tRNA (adenosine(37)-N6)-threonylcarbamoyltransferase complex dimerization subunit type 1 TsaB [Deinococcus yavapaiensis]|uniref:tRNA threonylcarbamoyl adenosine modification protein YeaZ n=1 Tax=Deinococcus yavapaiensis KR-236 TaxID=694435 RepID=A0A318SNW8_9DEIO|nr:tRNA (adenosine(37)-N6)-threonylcarbamoyltransferase complex dimerization subunit type 1 TsaB [Deinococcus yavapaiensis]PYE54440.1 tRNA threonylcarbamoyl adenosine modification protein YeaZ [Deinococcus yavapaiensis KR-236]
MILSIETATPFLVVGLVGQSVADERVERVERAHAERLPAIAEDFLRRDLDLVVIGTGPGSYTGVRVGASYALGVARARGVTVKGVSTLEAIAAKGEGPVAVSLDARKDFVYGARYEVANGIVTRVIDEPAKLSLAEFEARAKGFSWLRDEAPGGVALARLGEARGRTDWALSYL